MELLLQEKKVSHHNCEEDTKKYLVKILDHVRSIKCLRETIQSIEKAKAIIHDREQAVFKAFQNRSDEIQVISDFSLLN